MTTEKNERAYPATNNESGYCPWCDGEYILTIKGGYCSLQKYRCENCGETFYT